MTKNKSALIKSLIALMLSVSMLVGTTFAWFTDSVRSNNNIIVSGNIDVEMYWTDDLDNGTWHNVEDPDYNTIFSYDNWEPGYTDVKYIKIKNAGSLALNYKLAITPETAVGKLAEVINVHYATDGIKINDRTDLQKTSAIGLLSNVLRDDRVIEGTLMADGQQNPYHPNSEVVLTLAMTMITTAGNDYQNETAGSFGITALATQAPYEEDSFGANYDSAAELPIILSGDTVSAEVENVNGAAAKDVTLQGVGVSATLPAGTLLEDGADRVTLMVTPLEKTTSGITAVNGEILIPVDVHVDGVAENNTTPIVVNLGQILPKGLNMGNYTLYHVEDGTNKAMTLVNTAAELTSHNTFTYDPVTGEVSVAMASFSEVALIADTVNEWNGDVDEAFSSGTGTEDDPYIIANADQLAYFNEVISNDNENYGDKYYKLNADVNLGGEDQIFYPIGYHQKGGTIATAALDYENPEVFYIIEEDTKLPANMAADDGSAWYTYGGSFKGTFDGNGHKVSNIYQNTWSMKGNYDGHYWNAAMGLFGYVNGGTVKNLTVDNFSSDGEFTPTGVIAAYAANSTFENIAITNCNPRVYNTGNGGIVGIGGNSSDPDTYKLTFNNITIDNTNKISALWGSWDVACGGLVGMFRSAGHAYMTNCHVAAQIDVYNDVCGNYQYYWYRYSGMMIGTNKNMTTDKDGYTVPETSKFHAENCTVHFGEWNDYYYCELVANSLASYTHDHQFSRLEQISSLDEIKSGDTWTKTGNYLLISGDTKTCYHIVKDSEGKLKQHEHADAGTETVNGETVLKEDKQCVYLPFNQLFTGYGWGVKHIPVYNGENYAFDGITILDREIADSVDKFETKFTGDFLYRVGNKNTVFIGSLFAALETDEEGNEVKINDSGVYVTIDKVDENSNVSGTFTANTADWTQGTIQFSGTGVVKVTIQDYDYCKPTELYLEVVEATNTTTASFSGNTVLLNDVSTSSTLGASGVVYGNGFTVNMENAPISEKNGAVFHLYDGAVLKNLGIVGKEFTTVALNVNDTNYGVSAVRAWGTVTIENCYISGCRSAVSVTGTELTIKDSVIANGVYANVDFRSGILNLHNVTTINEPHSVNGTTVLGLGIVGNMTASAGRQLNITGELNQYNWVSKADCSNIQASGVSSIFNSVFTDSKYANLRYTYGETTYVNTGILSLCSDFGASAVTGIPDSYSGMDVTATISSVTVNGYVWAPAQSGTLTADDMKYHDKDYEWTATEQGTSYIAPAFNFSGAGLEAEDGVVQISYESGASYTLSAEILGKLLEPKKYNESLSFKISMNGTDYTGKDIVFNAKESKTYTITYTVTDNLIYNKLGNLTNNTFEVVKHLKVFATVVDKGADAPTFTFYYGTNGSASAGTPHTTQPTNSYTSKIQKVGEAYYIMPNVNTTTANAIGSQKVDGVTVYYPIVDGINVRSGSSTDYDFTRYYPVFKAVKISDNGTEYTYSGTKEMPATVAWVSATIDAGNGASSLNDGFGLYNNQYLCKIQKKAGDAEAGGTSVVKYSYTALDGNTYYYYVGYRFYNEDEGGLCVTPDTLITLADGSQKRVDEVTFGDKILAWDFFTGNYVEKDISILVNHGADVNNVIYTKYSDSSVLKLVGEHGVFDYDLNRFVYITADNVDEYVGHRFVKQNLNGGYDVVTMVEGYAQKEYVEAWSISSAETSNAFASGLLTVAPPEDFYNWIEMDGKLRYDVEKFAKDVETYGLYTYEDFSDYVTYEQFEDWNGAYLKIAVEKGYFTFEYILELIDLYKGWMA